MSRICSALCSRNEFGFSRRVGNCPEHAKRLDHSSVHSYTRRLLVQADRSAYDECFPASRSVAAIVDGRLLHVQFVQHFFRDEPAGGKRTEVSDGAVLKLSPEMAGM